MTKYFACWDYDDCLSILLDLLIKGSMTQTTLKSLIDKTRPSDRHQQLMRAAFNDLRNLLNKSSSGEDLTAFSTCSLRASKNLDQYNHKRKLERNSPLDQRLLNGDLTQAIRYKAVFHTAIDKTTVADLYQAIQLGKSLAEISTCALEEEPNPPFSIIDDSKFFMWILIAQRHKTLWPDETIVIDIYDDKLADKESTMVRGVERLKEERGLIPASVTMRFHAMDSYTLFYSEKSAFQEGLSKINISNDFKPFTSHHQQVASVNGTGELLCADMLREVADQCFKRSNLAIDIAGDSTTTITNIIHEHMAKQDSASNEQVTTRTPKANEIQPPNHTVSTLDCYGNGFLQCGAKPPKRLKISGETAQRAVVTYAIACSKSSP